MKKLLTITLILIGISSELIAQELTQTIRGKVIDETSEITLIGATVLLIESDPNLGAITDINGATKRRLWSDGMRKLSHLLSFITHELFTIKFTISIRK